MPFQISKGGKGRLRVGGVEFEVVDAMRSQITGIRFRHSREVIDVEDKDLVAAADNISEWGEKKPSA